MFWKYFAWHRAVDSGVDRNVPLFWKIAPSQNGSCWAYLWVMTLTQQTTWKQARIFVCCWCWIMETTKHQKSNDVEIGLSSCSASFGPGHHLMQVLLTSPLFSHINWAFNVNFIYSAHFLKPAKKRAFLQLGLSISTQPPLIFSPYLSVFITKRL